LEFVCCLVLVIWNFQGLAIIPFAFPLKSTKALKKTQIIFDYRIDFTFNKLKINIDQK